jgi:hypothetical protein
MTLNPSYFSVQNSASARGQAVLERGIVALMVEFRSVQLIES